MGNSALAKDAMGKQSAQIGLMFNMFSQFTSLVANRGGSGEANTAAQQGMQACTNMLLGGGDQKALLPGETPEKEAGSRKRKRPTGLEMRVFLADCNKEAKKLHEDLKSKDPDVATAAESEMYIHNGVVKGDIEPEEDGEKEKSAKILEIVHNLQNT